LGVLFWELSNGNPPFEGISNEEVEKKVKLDERETLFPRTPDDFKDLYIKAWDGDPDLCLTIEKI
ncbi:7707_t:CDS:1, partial [Scutellospora calospora]